MGRFCSLVGRVFGSSAYPDEAAFASHGEKQLQPQQPPPTPPPAFQSAGKKWRRKTAPEAADEHEEDDEAPPPVSKKTALLDKGKEKVSEMTTYFRRGKEISDRPSENSNSITTVPKSPIVKTAIGCMMSYTAVQRGRKIKILAFEVANTITKGSHLMTALSEQSLRNLKGVVLQTWGIQCLVSDDQKVLLSFVGADIRQDFKKFAADVARLGNLCIDPKWHNLDKNFSSLECDLAPKKRSKKAAASKINNLMALAAQTVLLFETFRRLAISENLYKNELKRPTSSHSEIQIQAFQNAVDIEKETAEGLKKISLWTKKMEDIVEDLVYIVHFLPSEINRVFPNFHKDGSVETQGDLQQTLGSADLHLNYARIINSIKSLSMSTAAPSQYAIDSLYEAVPHDIISVLRPKMKCRVSVDVRTETRLRREMTKTLNWMTPMADSTQRLFHYRGMLGDWVENGNPTPEGEYKDIKIQTLYHADRKKTEGYIVDMLLSLHYLIKASKLRIEEMTRPRFTHDKEASSSASSSTGIIE